MYDTNNQRPITSGDHSNLYIPSYTLTSGTVYLVTVNYSMNGVIDTQSYYFKTYSKPSGGFISVTPSSGEGYTTNFQLITGNWTDPDLKFRFGYYQSISEKGNVEKGDLGNPFYLSLFDTNQKITFKLPNFDTNNIIVTVFVIAKNQYGILEQIVQNMTVSPAPNSQTLFETFALEIILTNKNPSELINNVYVAFGLLDISFVKELQTETRINKLIQSK